MELLESPAAAQPTSELVLYLTEPRDLPHGERMAHKLERSLPIQLSSCSIVYVVPSLIIAVIKIKYRHHHSTQQKLCLNFAINGWL